MSLKDYVLLEERSQEKHEYFRGEVFLMSGSSPDHNVIATNLIIELGSLLRGSGCRVYNSDQRVHIADVDFATYPDVTVVCGPRHIAVEDNYAITNPTLIIEIEVLSPSTERYDRGKKFQRYRALDSLQSYILIDQEQAYVEHHQRMNDGNKWEGEYIIGREATLHIVSLGIDIPLSQIYTDVEFAAQPG